MIDNYNGRKLSHIHRYALGIWRHAMMFATFLQLMATTDGHEFPTYDHPVYKGQLCYQCPPGYFKQQDCDYSRSVDPQWPTCIKCPAKQFSQRWNMDGRCWDRQFCEESHVKIYDGGSTGPIKCSCESSMVEVDGRCVDAVTLKNHTNLMAQCQSDCDARVKAVRDEVTVPAPVCPPCNCHRVTTTRQPRTPARQEMCPPHTLGAKDSGVSAGTVVGIGVAAALLGSGITFIIILCCGQVTWKNKLKSMPKTNDASKAEGGAAHQKWPAVSIESISARKGSRSSHDEGLESPKVQQNGHVSPGRIPDPEPDVPAPEPDVQLPPGDSTSKKATEGKQKAANIILDNHADAEKGEAHPIHRHSSGADQSVKFIVDNRADEEKRELHSIHRNSSGADQAVKVLDGDHADAEKGEAHLINRNSSGSDQSVVVILNDHGDAEKNKAEPIHRDSSGSDQRGLEFHQGTGPVRENDPLDEACRILETELYDPDEVDRFMRNVLRFHGDDCEKVKIKKKRAASRVRLAFKYWRGRDGVDASVEKLVGCLVDNKWRSLAEKIALELEIPLKNGPKQKDDEKVRFDEACKICEERMTGKRDKEFLRSQLKLGKETMATLPKRGSDVMRKGLSKWRKREGTAATVEQLVWCLYEADILDVADEICESLNIQQFGGEFRRAVEETRVVQEDPGVKDGAGPEPELGVVQEQTPSELSSSSARSNQLPRGFLQLSHTTNSQMPRPPAQSSSSLLESDSRWSSRSDPNSQHEVSSNDRERREAKTIEHRTILSVVPPSDDQLDPRASAETDSEYSKDYNKEDDPRVLEDIDFEKDDADHGGKASTNDREVQESMKLLDTEHYQTSKTNQLETKPFFDLCDEARESRDFKKDAKKTKRKSRKD